MRSQLEIDGYKFNTITLKKKMTNPGRTVCLTADFVSTAVQNREQGML